MSLWSLMLGTAIMGLSLGWLSSFFFVRWRSRQRGQKISHRYRNSLILSVTAISQKLDFREVPSLNHKHGESDKHYGFLDMCTPFTCIMPLE